MGHGQKPSDWRRKQQGFSYFVAIFMVAIVAVLSLHAQTNMATKERRRKEDELLFVGQAYRDAIRGYYLNSTGQVRSFPPSIDVMLLDKRTNQIASHLRKAYLDPITGSANWGIVKAPDGGIMGVYSLSIQQPIKVDGFPDALGAFIGAKQYQNWKFVYQPM